MASTAARKMTTTTTMMAMMTKMSMGMKQTIMPLLVYDIIIISSSRSSDTGTDTHTRTHIYTERKV